MGERERERGGYSRTKKILLLLHVMEFQKGFFVSHTDGGRSIINPTHDDTLANINLFLDHRERREGERGRLKQQALPEDIDTYLSKGSHLIFPQNSLSLFLSPPPLREDEKNFLISTHTHSFGDSGH